ncbi:SPOR domain-containing protein [Desulfonema magnum]|uniref:Tetratricopeptide repeat-containing protein n=1 Tax=Desulfonema magnum TaxID=45655 RepID=A0A975BRY5_9BACT|nr:tetratricopeptide repeat protein [Desulfonema magnum]QTA90303.1 Tetratricopeptide repeat-containing protein [Desulfonema magnum]
MLNFLKKEQRSVRIILGLFVMVAYLLVPESSTGFVNWFKKGVSSLKSRQCDEAIAAFSITIEIIPDDFEAYHNRGVAWFYKKDYDKAIADYSKALEINPNYAEAYYSRGGAWFHKGDYDRAIADCTRALEINPNDFEAYNNRGAVWFCKGEYDKAIDDHNKSLKINPNYADAYQQIAWTLATCPDVRYRNGPRAVELAKKAVEIHSEPNFLDTLAAAYAETGNFENAITTQKNAIALSDSEGKIEVLAEYAEHLKSYAAHKPWREHSATRASDDKKTADSSPCLTKETAIPHEKKTCIYTIHILSYLNDKKMCDRAAAGLRKKGIPAFAMSVHIPGKGNWHHVFVGRYETPEDANNAFEKLEKKGFRPKVVRQ